MKRRFLELAAAVAAALCLSACGGAKEPAPPPPTLDRALASSLATQSDDVAAALAAGDSCGALTLAQGLQLRTIAAINRGRVSAGLQEQLSSAVNALVARLTCVPPPEENNHDHGKHRGRDKRDEGDQ